MKTIIAGSRSFIYYTLLCAAMRTAQLKHEITPSLVVSGGACGADSLAIKWALAHNIPHKVMKADWNVYGRSAGFVRNRDMALESEALVAVWDGVSKGTQHMIRVAEELGLRVCVVKF